MKGKKNKLSNREIEKRLDYLFQSCYEIGNSLGALRALFESYIIWKKDVKKFTKHLENEAKKRESETREEKQAEGS